LASFFGARPSAPVDTRRGSLCLQVRRSAGLRPSLFISQLARLRGLALQVTVLLRRKCSTDSLSLRFRLARQARTQGRHNQVRFPPAPATSTKAACQAHLDANLRPTARNCGPAAIVTDHDQPYVRAARQNLPGSLHIRTGLHRLTGETTKPIERSHIATRDRLRASRGLKTTATGQRFLEGFEAVQALRRGVVALRCLVPAYRRQLATRGDRARAVPAAMGHPGSRAEQGA
jgi:hypothetical protein